MLAQMKYLNIRLPEDIERYKKAGFFKKAGELIEKKIEKGCPEPLKKRLELELELFHVWEEEYPYSEEDALIFLKKRIEGITEEEFKELTDAGEFDWIYREGKRYYLRTFYENLLKIGHPLTKRLKAEPDPEGNAGKQRLLNESMKFMKENGGTAWKIRIRTTLKIREESIRKGHSITVHLPVPTLGTQVRRIEILDGTQGMETAPEDFPSRTACFQGPVREDGTYFVEYQYENHLRYIRPEAELAERRLPDWSGEFLREEEPHITFTPMIKDLYREIVGDEDNPLKKAEKIYIYITGNIRYSYVRKYSILPNIAEYAAVNGKGDCGVQAVLFITLCRYGGIPARFQSGLYAAPGDVGGHDWAQFYIEPYGWLFADLSFGGSARRIGNEERRRFYFGNLDPFRMPANSAFQHEFFRPQKFLRQDPTDNQYGECEYEDRALSSWEYETVHQIVEIRQIQWEGEEK